MPTRRNFMKNVATATAGAFFVKTIRATAWNGPGAFAEEPSMTPLRQRMLEDMQVRNLSPRDVTG